MEASTTPTQPKRRVLLTLRDKYFQPCKLVQLQNVSKLVQERWYTLGLLGSPLSSGGWAEGVEKEEWYRAGEEARPLGIIIRMRPFLAPLGRPGLPSGGCCCSRGQPLTPLAPKRLLLGDRLAVLAVGVAPRHRKVVLGGAERKGRFSEEGCAIFGVDRGTNTLAQGLNSEAGKKPFAWLSLWDILGSCFFFTCCVLQHQVLLSSSCFLCFLLPLHNFFRFSVHATKPSHFLFLPLSPASSFSFLFVFLPSLLNHCVYKEKRRENERKSHPANLGKGKKKFSSFSSLCFPFLPL